MSIWATAGRGHGCKPMGKFDATLRILLRRIMNKTVFFWAQHIATLPQERWIRRILRWCPAGRHRTGRPHFFLSKLESYCKYKGLGRWIEAAMNRDVWDQHCKFFIEFCCTQPDFILDKIPCRVDAFCACVRKGLANLA